jgi:parallel beta-helix repeat protein
MKKGVICVHVCMLMILTTIVPLSATTLSEKTSHPLTKGITFHVGGLGPNNFTEIQDAIDAASDGDTVFVYDDSSPYRENIMIDKPIYVLGENKETTIIDGMNNGNVVSIMSNSVRIAEFTLQNGGWGHYAGVFLENSNFCIIQDNIIKSNNWWGICLNSSSFNDIYENYLTLNAVGIEAGGFGTHANYNVFKHNKISKNEDIGVAFGWSKHNIFCYNIISDSFFGISFWYNDKNIIYENIISNNSINGLDLGFSRQNTILCNNFYDNGEDAHFLIMNLFQNNKFLRNYWNEPLSHPKRIFGELNSGGLWREFDWHPAQEPYDIP